MSTVHGRVKLDRTDARLLRALGKQPRATVLALAEKLRLSRNTVQARLARIESTDVLLPFERRIDPAAIGYPVTAVITVRVRQQMLAEVSDALADVPEVVEVFGLTGPTDLLVSVVAPNADDLYRIAGVILATPGVERTDTALVMRRLVEYRIDPLLRRLAQAD
ncbi:MAG TPA: Lrp/AsnC family transcriptional regulator [Mycobacteriales bacterium]|jgi:DNA-binding Lrp family transcriptional regulator|nr:Lrp/AsnC family transcriptional regulator [Mycobacteriales bacterium]